MRDGYNFTGWDRDFDVVRTSMTVTATYAIQTFTVTFVDFDGTELGTDTVDWNTAPARRLYVHGMGFRFLRSDGRHDGDGTVYAE